MFPDVPIIEQSLERVGQIPRQLTLLQSPSSAENRPVMVIPFNPHNLPIKRIVLDNWSLLKDDPMVGHLFSSPPLVACKRMPNIRDRLFHSRLRNSSAGAAQLAPGTHSCTKKGCVTCPFLVTDTVVVGSLSMSTDHFTVRCTTLCMSFLAAAVANYRGRDRENL